jgi:hypothetical protein
MIAIRGAPGILQEVRCSFFEKKEPKKLLSFWGASGGEAGASALTWGREKSFFGSFF